MKENIKLYKIIVKMDVVKEFEICDESEQEAINYAKECILNGSF